jgi:TPR repeat protein
VTYRDLFKVLTYPEAFGLNHGMLGVDRHLLDNFYMNMYYLCEQASEAGIYEAHYYFGVMNQQGFYTKINKKKAFYYYCLAASNSHALSFYELYHLLRNDDTFDYIYSDRTIKSKAMIDYLKHAAEEGYPAAMYELGNEYIKGEICPKNYYLALAWHRHACRNGYFLSYEQTGDLFYKGGENFRPNKILSLVMYFSAYQRGVHDIKDKILKLRDELISEGEEIPEMILI